MNFLAHIFLSGDSLETMLGNFIADFVRGNQINQFDQPIIKGILLHRQIDEYTDKHPTVQVSKQRLRPKFRHYSGVISDIYFDHFLVKNWGLYSSENIEEYIQRTYKSLQAHSSIFPERGKQLLHHMVKNNLLLNYGREEGLRRSFAGMARRTNYVSRLDEATDELFAQYEDFRKDFLIFFPQLIGFSQKIRGL